MSRHADAPLPVEGSWRMVEGEHDSFDTTILPSVRPDDGHHGGQPSSSGFFPSQPSSQANASTGSQDSIRDFAKHRDDDHVILREPFRPSMLSTTGPAPHDSLEPRLRMPLLDMGTSRRSSGDSSRTLRPSGLDAGYDGAGAGPVRRRRRGAQPPSPSSRRPRRPTSSLGHGDDTGGQHKTAVEGRFLAALPWALYKLCVWVGQVIAIAMTYAKYPLAALLAVYLVFGGLIVAQNMATRSLSAAVSPVCRVPGVSLLGLPFCPPASGFGMPNATAGHPVEFGDLMGVQSQFEQVLEKSADGVSLPFEMKRSEAAVRDLRSLVRHSDIRAKHELVVESDGYIDAARRAAADLQRFNAHVGSAVDAVISINRWTSRYIDSLAPDAVDGPPSTLSAWASWLFSPFQPTDEPFSERAILDQYVEHTALVADRISALILEAQAILRLLTTAEDHLALVYDIASRSSASLSSRRDQVLWNVWTLVGANTARLHNLSRQLALLRQVDAQRSSAIDQVSALILELEAMQAGLGDLRDHLSEPELVAVAAVARIPLSVHIETIDRGVERLQGARARIRAAEDERVRDIVARGGVRGDDHRLIDPRGR